ncbi:hypothetical protein HO476_06950 [Streptococcus suis]|nr:hypothetical protein [Streptococcus suis]HEM4119386.1 hypothetical protein [Streptococcus suis]HEM4120043.1 hypothetical protein [Streptococcus suis]
MNKLNQHEVQFDYFSSNYDHFEKDFYKFSALNVPLTFMTDDILSLMMNNNTNFFRLTANKSKDKRDHYFYFRVNATKENKTIRIFEYIGHSYQLQK